MSLLADLFSRSTDGVFAVDVKERIVFWNAACKQLLGIPAQRAIGHACFDVVHAGDLSGQPFCKPGYRMARLAKGGSATQPIRLRFDNGRGKSQKLSVRNHIQHLNKKVGVHSQLEAVAHACRHDLIQSPGADPLRVEFPAARSVSEPHKTDLPYPAAWGGAICR